MGVTLANQSDDYDRIVILFNEFKSAIAYEQRQVELLTRSKFMETMAFGKLYDMKLPDKNTSNSALYELYLTSNLWVALLQNATSE